MKKIILVAAFMIMSIGVLAYGGKYSSEDKGKGENYQGRKYERICEMKEKYEKLSEAQKVELEKIRGEFRRTQKLLSIEKKEKSLEVEKLMLEKTVDWRRVERALEEKAEKDVASKLKRLQYKKMIEEKFGIEMNYKNRRGHKNHKNRDKGNRKQKMGNKQ